MKPIAGHQPPEFFQLLKDTNVDFMGKRYFAFALSGVLVVLGIIAAANVFITGQANLGIEFTGGTSVTLEFQEPLPLDQVRALLIQNGLTNPQITDSNKGGRYRLYIRVKEEASGETGTVEITERIKQLFTDTFPDNPLQPEGTSSISIGPAIGEELRQKAIWAIIYSIIGIIIYIAVRFDFKFGLAATVATFHDALAVLGIMWLKNFIWPTEITLLIMTAILTIAGYSLTDTVVVFDRIRENIKKHQRLPLEQLINSSINQVLSRTTITSLTTALVVVAIFVLGGEVLHDFAFALLIGIIVGTYSSWFVASPLLLLWRGRRGKLLSEAEPVRKRRVPLVK